MAVAEAVLNSPDYFRCEKQRCRMRKAACVALQERVKDNGRFDETHPCRACAQGRKIKAEIGGTAILVVQHGRDAHVTSGAGSQATSAIEAPAAPGPTVSPCARCGNSRARNTTYGRLCHSCHSKQMYADGTAKHQGKTNPDVYRHADDPGKTVSKPEDVPQANVLVLNFKDYPELYRELQERAEADYRNLDQEVFYALDVVFKPSDHLEAKEKT